MFGQGSRLRALKEPIALDSPLLTLDRDGDSELEWRQPRWDQYLYRLESPRGLLAVMQTVGFLQLRTTIQSAAGAYHLEPRWNGGLKLFFEEEEEPRLDYHPSWWFGGRIESRGGETLQWKAEGLRRHGIETSEGFALAAFASGKEWFKSHSEVTLHDALWRRDDATELLILGFAILVITSRRTSN